MPITRSEVRWLIIVTALVTAALHIPIIYGYLIETPDLRFSGFYIGLSDIHSYIGKGRYGATVEGWQFKLFYTGEPHDGAYLFPFYLGVGKLIGAGGTYAGRVGVMAHHIATLIGGGTLLIAVYVFVAHFTERVALRRVAWLLVVCTGGLDWPLIAAGLIPMVFYIPESFTFLTVSGLPHIALAEALFLMGWLCLFTAIERTQWGLAAAASALWFTSGLLVPFYCALLGLLIAAWLGGLALRRRALPLTEFSFALLAGSLPIVIIVYNLIVLRTNPAFAIYLNQTPLPPPPAYQTLAAYAPYLVLGAAIVPAIWRQAAHQRHLMLLLAWPLVVFPLVYVEPIQIQRRMLVSVIVPLAILAVHGADHLIQRRQTLRPAIVGMLALTAVTFPLYIVGAVATLSAQARPAFIDHSLIETVTRLQAQTPPYEAVILATEGTGNIIPAYAQHRVYLGHGPETLYSDRKRQEVPAFFSGGMSPEQQQTLLRESGVTHVLIGPAERALCPADLACVPTELLGLTLIYTAGDYDLYTVD